MKAMVVFPCFCNSLPEGNHSHVLLSLLCFFVIINITIIYYLLIFERSLEAKLPTIWADGKAPQLGRSSDVEKIRGGESHKREDAGAQKGRKVAKHCVFPMFCGS